MHRSSEDVWGTCTFHEYTARCPNRATTVRAHNWVVLGVLLLETGEARLVPADPACSTSASRSCRLRPSREPSSGPNASWPSSCFASRPAHFPGKHLAIFDGGFALRSVVRPLVLPEDGSPRIEFLTRLRHDARLFALPPAERPPGQRGPKPKWGRGWSHPVAAVAGRGNGRKGTPSSTAGGGRPLEGGVCLWRVLGYEVPVKAVVAGVEGYTKRFDLVTSAVELTGLQMVELFAARFRQEDGFRDLKQRLGWEECRAWTKNPIERTRLA